MLRFLGYFDRGMPHKNPGPGIVLRSIRQVSGRRNDSGMVVLPGVFAIALKRATTCLLCLIAASWTCLIVPITRHRQSSSISHQMRRT